jgi:glycosyltransferase involved in cell wall biosynthesis
MREVCHKDEKEESGATVNIWIIARYFPPLQSSGTLRNEAFARHLPKFGISPVVVTGSGDQADFCQIPGAALVTGGSDQSVRQPESGVLRIPWTTAQFLGRSRVRGFLNRLPLVSSCLRHFNRAHVVTLLAEAVRPAMSSGAPRAILASVPPPETLLLALQLGREYEVPVVADFRDLWSYAPGLPYRHLFDFWFERQVERRALQSCDLIVVNTKTAATVLKKGVGVPEAKIRVVRNGYEEDDFANSLGTGPIELGKFSIVYTGELSLGLPNKNGSTRRLKQTLGLDYHPLQCNYDTRSPRWFLGAVEQLLDRNPEMRTTVQIWFVGLKTEWHDRVRQAFRYPECLQLVGRVESKVAVQLACQADLLLLSQNEYRWGGVDCCVAIPAKLYTYLRTGRPILACVQESEIADLVREYRAGTVVDPRDIPGIASGVMDSYKAWDDGGRQWIAHCRAGVSVFRRDEQARSLASLLREVAAD